MEFFDSTSIGQILNLSSKDTDYMDTRLNGTYYSFFSILFSLIGTFVILIIANYYSSILIVVLIIIFSWLIVKYLRASTELRRLEQISFSPIVSNITELYNGLAIYRGLGKTDYMIDRYEARVDNYTST